MDQIQSCSDDSLSTYLPLNVLDSWISERRLPFKGLGLMTLIEVKLIDSDDTATRGAFETLSDWTYESELMSH